MRTLSKPTGICLLLCFNSTYLLAASSTGKEDWSANADICQFDVVETHLSETSSASLRYLLISYKKNNETIMDTLIFQCLPVSLAYCALHKIVWHKSIYI